MRALDLDDLMLILHAYARFANDHFMARTIIGNRVGCIPIVSALS